MSQDDQPYLPYGAPYGDQPPPSRGYGHLPPPVRSEPNVAAIVALTLNLFSVFSCCNVFGIVGAILAGRALGAGTRPEKARSYVTSSWIVLGAGFAVMAVLFLYLGVNGHFDD
ncbi:hypothetical protein [Nonomuraea sp. NPDC048826]|uniref:hypothetical protein n=1 Tax=Nonomuraea sp. NPDC048826 TaxID=3364347 RepID=UPI00371025D8